MFEGKIALVTGGSRGIGRAVALRLAESGADVVLTYMRKRSAAEEVVADIQTMGRRALAAKASLGVEEDVAKLMKSVSDFGGLDILVANAATGVMEPLMEATPKHWNWVFEANVRGFLMLVQQAVPLFQRQGSGQILALSSPGSSRVTEHYGLVGSSKAALESLVRYLAVELAQYNVSVNAVSPGLVDTDAAGLLPRSADLLTVVERQTPAGKLVTPEDVANVVLLLLDDAAKMIVGQVIVVDGGHGLMLGAVPE